MFVAESYVAELMKHKAGAGQAAPPPPRIGKFRSADVSAPYVLACHHTDSNSKIVSDTSLPTYLPSLLMYVCVLNRAIILKCCCVCFIERCSSL